MENKENTKNKVTETLIKEFQIKICDENGNILELYENTLCAQRENLKNAKETIAIACGKDKASAIIGALRTQLIDTLITDEYTAKYIVSALRKHKK